MKGELHSGFSQKCDHVIKNMTPLLKRPLLNKSIPNIVNMVSTTSILPPGYRLPLRELNVAMGPCSQYAPVQFAANILSITTSTTDSTVLVFGSGKLVLVSAISENHTQYINQFFRHIIEQIKCVMLNESNKPTFTNLVGRTVFENNVTHNVVGHGDLGMRIDLNALRDSNPGSVKWLPDSFPAAKCSIWITDDNMCHCQGGGGLPDDELESLPVLKKIVKRKCHCTIKCLCFDTGKIVMIGGEHVKDVNFVFYRMQQLVPKFRTANQKIIPQEDRFEHRLGTMLAKRYGPEGDLVAAPKHRSLEPSGYTQTEEIALVLYNLHKFRPKHFNKVRKIDHVYPPLIQFAIDGRVNELKTLLSMDPDLIDSEDAKEAIRLLTVTKSSENAEILKVLQGVL
jgi:TATA-box binding protein (TBP) (component of TFIID and TFIIIB)